MRTIPVTETKKSKNSRKIYFTTFLSGALLTYLLILHAASIHITAQDMIHKFFNRYTHKVTAETKSASDLQKDIHYLKNRFDRLTPKRPYLIINTSDNYIYLKKKHRLLYEGQCSSGSDVILKANDGQKWVFKTPRGIFKIQMKLKQPVWYMPEWAFIETGRDVPPANSKKRFNSKALGDYALSIGGGYMIHGTAYTRLIGQPVTHGCVRLDNEALNMVYKNLKYGAKVYIY
jgi:hypothetical protein